MTAATQGDTPMPHNVDLSADARGLDADVIRALVDRWYYLGAAKAIGGRQSDLARWYTDGFRMRSGQPTHPAHAKT